MPSCEANLLASLIWAIQQCLILISFIQSSQYFNHVHFFNLFIIFVGELIDCSLPPLFPLISTPPFFHYFPHWYVSLVFLFLFLIAFFLFWPALIVFITLIDTYPCIKCNYQGKVSQKTTASRDEMAKLKSWDKFARQCPSSKCNAFNSMACTQYLDFIKLVMISSKSPIMNAHLFFIPVIETIDTFFIL